MTVMASGLPPTDLLAYLEGEYLPRLRSLEAVLRERYPEVRFQVSHSAVGDEGHELCLEATFFGRPADQSDCLTLTICLWGQREPRLMADVGWDPPDPFVEDSLEPDSTSQADWPAADAPTLQHLADAFPRLLQAFKDAVARGQPTG